MSDQAAQPNVLQAVPFFGVRDIQRSLRFYVDGLGFAITRQWVYEGAPRWCWLELDNAALMLQEFWPEGHHNARHLEGPLGQGVNVCFICRDALAIYHAARSRGLTPQRPFVGNRMWVVSFTDPDGYRMDFESDTDAPEESVYAEPAP